MDPRCVPPFAGQTRGAQIAAYPFEVPFVQGVVIQAFHPYVSPYLRRTPVADGIEIRLIGDERIPRHQLGPGPREGLQRAVPLACDGAFGEIAGDEVRYGSELAHLAAPSEILRRRTECIYILPESVLGIGRMQTEAVLLRERLHILQGLRELEPRIGEQEVRVADRLGRETVGRQGVLASGE